MANVLKGNCFLFLGPELGEKLDVLQKLRAKLQAKAALRFAADSAAGIEETSFYAGDTPFDDIVSVIRNASLFCEERLIIIKNADTVKKKD